MEFAEEHGKEEGNDSNKSSVRKSSPRKSSGPGSEQQQEQQMQRLKEEHHLQHNHHQQQQQQRAKRMSQAAIPLSKMMGTIRAGGAKLSKAAAGSFREGTKLVTASFATGKDSNGGKRKGSFMFNYSKDEGDIPTSIVNSPVIYTSMREQWMEDVSKLPVYKDLPRLIRRVCVLNAMEDILFLPDGGAIPLRTKPYRPSGSVSSAASENEDTNARESNLSQEGHRAIHAGHDEQEMEEDEADDTPAARRSERAVRWSMKKKKEDFLANMPKETELGSNLATFKLIRLFIKVLADFFEPEEERERITNCLQNLEETMTESGDMELVVRDLLSALGSDSCIVRVLKCIHQNVVLHGMVELKQNLTLKYSTKDIRTPDGWRIVVSLNPGYVQVRHIRREQSVDAFGDTKNHWELEWELRMTFDQKMVKMTAAQLRITKLTLSETMDPELADELKSTLVDGLIVM